MKLDKSDWSCIKCINKCIPFSKSTNETLKLIMQGKNINNTSLLDLDNLGNVNFFQDINGINLGNNTHNQSLYYTLSELNNIKHTKGSISFFHLNIASLSLHFDELHTIIASSETKFDFIAISETGRKKNVQPIHNIMLDGYNFIECPTESNKGGVGLYISKKYDFKPRTDLQIYKSKKIESIFIEIPNKKGKNMVVGCLYRHPSMSISEFNITYLERILEKLSFENKDIFLLGDFNINLMNFDNNTETNDFLDLITS